MNFEKICKELALLFIASIPMMPIFTMNLHYALGILSIMMYFLYIVKEHKIAKFNIFEIFYMIFLVFCLFRIDERIVYNSSRSLEEYMSDSYYMIKNMIFSFFSIIINIRILYTIYKDVNKTIEIAGNTFLIGTIIVSCYSIFYEYLILGDIERLGTYVFANEYGTRITYTHDLTISLFFAMYNIFNKRVNKSIYYVVMLVLIIMILLSGTRKLIVALLLFVVIYQIFNKKRNNDKVIMGTIVLVVLIPIMYYLMINVSLLYNLYGNRIESFVQSVLYEDDKQDASASQRNRMKEKALLYYQEEPIWGIGTNGFKFRFEYETGIFKYSHNNYTEILCDLGIVGFIMYYGGIVIILLKLIRKNRKEFSAMNILFISSIITLLVLDIWNVCYYRIQFLFIYELAGLYILTTEKHLKKKRDFVKNGE